MTVVTKRYLADGFLLLDQVAADGLRSYPCAAVKIEKGHAVHSDGSGYATDAVTALTSKFLGIAAAECDNSAGSAGDLKVLVIPPLPQYRFIVPCANDGIMAITDKGLVIDLEAAGTVDNSDVSVASGPGFLVEDIDISAEAVAVNTYGYAIGRFTFIS
jgi:hypothetical protein